MLILQIIVARYGYSKDLCIKALYMAFDNITPDILRALSGLLHARSHEAQKS